MRGGDRTPTTSLSISNENYAFVTNRATILKQGFSKTVNGILDDERMRAAHEIVQAISSSIEERAERVERQYPKTALKGKK